MERDDEPMLTNREAGHHGPLGETFEPDAPKRPPHPMVVLKNDLVAALQETVKEARDLPDAVLGIEARARVLASCAEAWASLDQAASQRTLARLTFEREAREARR